MSATESNKAKIARRVVEVLEFFDEDHPNATVMDIVRRYNRPQSSTSELLSSLVALGLLYKDHTTRSFAPTPRAALLGCSVQSGVVRDGRLAGLIDRLSAQTGLGIAVFGMVGTTAQIFNWRPGKWQLRTSQTDGLAGGQHEVLTETAAGHLLLSTLPQARRDGLLRRINAEAPAERKFVFGEMVTRIQACGDHGYASGVAGFGSIADVTAMLLPDQPEGQPLAIGLIYEPSEQINAEVLRETLGEAIARCIAAAPDQGAEVERLAGVA
ncbi:helix-turn-helix domain-containing protein [Novosphingobium aerophilum]|uniref:Helix-turn-helix domain-containing protein n=1 Tax=Novosphingobium aerophilum TaxID=2839843 RepID=A0A7X1KAU5_9SPHN|nr:helix-turn-helix domain-containing protein [Novosphingobium aerophilum]MBC2650392.1 helix-turn-helix domain-containing protein [Novosphingobium aerophilum]